jgi:hypothetical protein
MTDETTTDVPEDGDDVIIRTDEDGIRVKGGSVTLETVSPGGFELDTTDPLKHKFKTVKETKGEYRIAVNHGTCTPDFYADNVFTVELTIEDRSVTPSTTRTVVLSNASSGSAKKLSLPATGFMLVPGSTQITTIALLERLARIRAFDDGLPTPAVLLTAEPTSPTVHMEAYLAVKK